MFVLSVKYGTSRISFTNYGKTCLSIMWPYNLDLSPFDLRTALAITHTSRNIHKKFKASLAYHFLVKIQFVFELDLTSWLWL